MSYVTQAEIALAAGGDANLLSVADWDGDGVVDANVIAEAQKRSDAWIDGYLRVRFETPIAAPSDDIKRIAADEAVYWMRKARNMIGPDHAAARTEREREMSDYRDGKRRPDEPLPKKSTAVKTAIVDITGDVTREGLKGMW